MYTEVRKSMELNNWKHTHLSSPFSNKNRIDLHRHQQVALKTGGFYSGVSTITHRIWFFREFLKVFKTKEGGGSTNVLQLFKNLYGQKQNKRVWNHQPNDAPQAIGFKNHRSTNVFGT